MNDKRRGVRGPKGEPGPRTNTTLLVTLAALGLAALLGLAVVSTVVIVQGNYSEKNRALALRADRIATQTRKLARSIQRQRINSILTSCRETNRRHDKTVRRLDQIIVLLPPGPEKDRAKLNRANTVLLINALQPKADCKARLKKLNSPPIKPFIYHGPPPH